jgi:hypothetical protein
MGIGTSLAIALTSKFQVQESCMKICRVVVLLAGSLVFAHAISAQSPAVVSVEESPVLDRIQPAVSASQLFGQQAQPAPPSASALPQSETADSLATEDRYKAEIERIAQKERQFVHCKLKNGKVLTGMLRGPGDKSFAVQTNALGDGTIVDYKNLAESPRAVPAVGTRIKQGAQLTGFVVFVVVFFIPLALAGVIPSC